ncbi:MAG: hypothetical protein KGZ68_12495 [Dechloromonas sp.]|nr:hypothetical protein [Dechloromonas sp.]
MTPAEREALIREGMRVAQTAMENLDEAGEVELQRIYRQASADLRALIENHAGPDGSIGLAQLRDLLDQVESRMDQLSVTRDATLDSGLRVASELGAQPFLRTEVDTPALMRVPDEALRFVRAFVGADGLQLSDRLWRIDRGARDAVVNAVERSVVMGHGAAQAAAEFLRNGLPVPGDVRDKLNAAGAVGMGREATEIMTGGRAGGGAMAQAQRVFRTEINRAHGVAYMSQAEKTPGFKGFRFTLSPAHPKPDICDELAAADKFGLGEGVYPSMAEFLKIWPAHPNTLSFPVGVFGSP